MWLVSTRKVGSNDPRNYNARFTIHRGDWISDLVLVDRIHVGVLMVIYKVVGFTNPVDWASMPEDKILGYYQSRFGAEDKVADMMREKDWKYDWSSFIIDEIEVNP